MCVCVCVCVRERERERESSQMYTNTHEKERENSFSHTYTPRFNFYAQTHTRKTEHPCNIKLIKSDCGVLFPQVWFEKTPLGKKRKKAAQGDEPDAGAKLGKKGKKGKIETTLSPGI